MKRSTVLLVLSVFWTSMTFAGDIKKGREIYVNQCASCHGDKALGNKAKKSPRLAGQFDWYLVSSLKDFQKKKRVAPEMYPYIKDLSAEDMENVSSYISQIK